MRLYIDNKKDLLNVIDEYERISFDIFDTLIMRKTLSPDDVFEIMHCKLQGQFPKLDFVKDRRKAILENDIPNPNIYQIYDKFMELTGLSKKDTTQILKMELELEKSVLIRRDSMVEILQEVKRMGKSICLITDMYLPTEIIVEILNDLQITQYDDILVSCDYRTLKCEELFDCYKKKYDAQSYLHIGDNLYSDIECAQKRNIDCIAIESGLTKFRKSAYGKVEVLAETLSERNILGMFVAKLYNDPFLKSENLHMDLMQISELFINPLVFCMMEDLKNVILRNHYDKILFAARDGYLLKHFYDIMKNENYPEGVYFYTSRKAVTNINLENDDQILWLANLPYSYKKEEILSCVFKVEGKDYDESRDYNENILAARTAIIKRSKELGSQYKKYMDNIGLNGGKYLFVDLVSSGTCQMHLEKIVNGRVEGYYLGKIKTNEVEKEKLKYFSLFKNVDINNIQYGFHKMYYLIESILTSYESSLDYFDEDGKPIFTEEVRSQEQIVALRQIHERMQEYFETMLFMCEGQGQVSCILVDKLISIFLENYVIGRKIQITLRDDWMNTDVVVYD